MVIFDGVSILDTGCWGVFHGGNSGFATFFGLTKKPITYG